jgi:hypothetical protein
MDTAYIYIVMVSENKRKRVHFFKPGVSNVRLIILSPTWAMYGELFPARREKSRVNYFKTGVNNVR